MRGLIPDSFIDELLARVDIVDVIERRVPLKKAGREWTACCPFHNERTPSFYVSPAKQFFHCFGCGAHGSAVKFLMDYERLEFPDAVEELAQTVGLTVPREGGREAAPREDKTDLYALLDAAAAWYEGELPRNADAQAYCRKRGLDAETIRRFRLGWAPAGYDGVIKALGNTPRRMELLNEAGMVASSERGSKYDRFRERLMFPILDRRGRVIAFGGRIIERSGEGSPAPDARTQDARKSDGPKYLNSPETPLFHKGRELFALWQVKQANPTLARIVVVEGYMDVIALHQAGLPIAVATLGTATTPEHTEVLFRAAPDVVFCFDGDRAGRAAAWKALESALPRLRDGRQAYFLFLPDGEDPDSLVRKEGKAGFEQRIRDAMPLSDYFFNELSHDVDMASLDGRARLAERARPLIAKLPDGAFRDLMAQELEKRSGARAVLQADPAAHRAMQRPTAVQRSLVRSAISLLLAQPGMADQVEKPYRFLRLDKPGVELLAELLDLARARPGINSAMLVEHFAERPEYPSLQKLMAALAVGELEAQRSEFFDALARMEDQAITQRRDALTAKSREAALDPAEKTELRELLAARVRPPVASA
ncbi:MULTISPECIES: DNA primase [Rhodanobacter]|uniref:DNA primase n=1 Tax=Rhodanobacter TaxID=75309 RepID=UPI0003FE23DB|nr:MULTISPECIES: DNA primase [Rhodanobacter]KZC20872.1 DNA primase [Rhodanobacter denitrificans]UJJ59834.1 DNA primase [Rhodanobacter denitrificans]UJM94129.1 DNA primase [Rhodanobacter denitrificans]UJM97658.1 DNA primase [Rhodanobacter denitrificans]UJN22927.1 DNA primase [Rhodanobacter denitrificans]